MDSWVCVWDRVFVLDDIDHEHNWRCLVPHEFCD